MSRLSPREKRIALGLCVLSALPLGLAALAAYLEAAPDIVLPPRAPVPAPNGYDLYLQAAKLTAQPSPPIDPMGDYSFEELSAAEKAERYSLSRREAWNRGAARGWELFERAKRAQTQVPLESGSTDFPNWSELRILARAKAAQSELYRMRGEPGEAAQSALDAIELGVDIKDGGSFIGGLVSYSIVHIGLGALNNRDHLPERLNAAQSRAARVRLESLAGRRPLWAAIIDAERWWQLAHLQKSFERPNWRDGEEPILGEPDDSLMTRARRRLTSRRAVAAGLNRMADHAIASLQKPYNPRPIEPPAGLDLLSKQSWVYGNAGFFEAHNKTSFDLLILRLALQAYRAENGAYPRALSALEGNYLRQIPRDSFAGGRPYRYVLCDGKYRLWSVGPDAVDDGGRAIAAAPDDFGLCGDNALPCARFDSKGDIVAGETQ